MSRLRQAIARANANAARLPESRQRKLHRDLNTDWSDLVQYQQLQASTHAAGKLSTSDALVLFRLYGGNAPSAAKWDRLTIGEKVVGTKAAEEMLRMQREPVKHGPRTVELNPGQPLYEAFHGKPPNRKRRLKVPVPTGELVAIGRAVRIEYEPYGSSDHKQTRFFHEFGDTGEGRQPKLPILATDKKGKHLFIVPTSGKYPYFSERGIIG